MSRPNGTIPSSLVALAILLGLTGCSTAPVTAPPLSGGAPPGALAPAPPSRLASPTGQLTGPLVDTTAVTLDWRVVSTMFVLQGVDADVIGNRYRLKFAKGSLAKSEFITIREYDPNVIDVQLGPHGTRFGTPVELSIDFAGTSSDPRTGRAEQNEPVLWYLNETTNRWEEVTGGTTDWVHLKYIVRLEHFSRYVLGGKAGWKHSPSTESDN